MRAPSPRPARPAARDDLSRERARLALGFLLLALAGWVDAVGFVRWNELYVSFMSGNTAQLGASPALGEWHATTLAGRALAMFVLGTVAGELAGSAAGGWRGPVVVTGEAALLWLAATSVLAGWGDATTASVAGLAMGVQTAALHKADGLTVPLTYVTGTLVNLGRAVAAALGGAAPWRNALPFAGFWLSLLGGSVAGSLAARAGLAVALVSAAGIASALALFAGMVARRHDA